MTAPSAAERNQPQPALPGLAYQCPAAWARLVIPAVIGLGLDLWSKGAAFPRGVDVNSDLNGVHPGIPPIPIIPNILAFQTTINHGAVFGIGQGRGGIFVVFSFIALGAILMVFAKSRRDQFVLQTALGLITAGAMGNLFDRIVFGGVVRDFMRFYVSWYPYIFNVADVLLCIGVPLLMLCWLFPPKDATAPQGFPVEAKPKG
jgi:signal peptidase II